MPTPYFKPGQSGSPAGRPKDKTPATLLRKAIADDMPDELWIKSEWKEEILKFIETLQNR